MGLPVAAALGGLVAIKLLGPDYVDPQELLAVFQPMGAWAPLAFVAFLAVRPVALLPGQLLCAVGGMIFGGFWGAVYALIGSLLSTSLVFGIGRRIGTGPMRRLWGRRAAAVAEVTRHNDFRVAAVCTVNPLLPTDLVVAVMSASGARYVATVAGVFLGTIPGTIATAQFGASLGKGDTVMTVVASTGIALSLVLGTLVGRRISRELSQVQHRLGAEAAAAQKQRERRVALPRIQPDAS